MRRLLAVLLTLGMAACQTPAAPPPVEQWHAERTADDVSPNDLFDAWFSVNIPGHCGMTVRGTVEQDDCVKTMILAAFDDSGQARKDCRRNSDMGYFSECVIYGSWTRELMMKRNPRMTIDLNWRAAKASLTMVFDKTIRSEVIAACADTETATFHVCERQQLAKSLELPAEAATACGSGKVNNWRHCIFNAYIAKQLAKATARLQNPTFGA